MSCCTHVGGGMRRCRCVALLCRRCLGYGVVGGEERHQQDRCPRCKGAGLDPLAVAADKPPQSRVRPAMRVIQGGKNVLASNN